MRDEVASVEKRGSSVTGIFDRPKRSAPLSGTAQEAINKNNGSNNSILAKGQGTQSFN